MSGNICENGQLLYHYRKTVGYSSNRYRLGHKWVPEMVLNVQSDRDYWRKSNNSRLSLIINYESKLCKIIQLLIGYDCFR